MAKWVKKNKYLQSNLLLKHFKMIESQIILEVWKGPFFLY